jgi:hypothetical protein
MQNVPDASENAAILINILRTSKKETLLRTNMTWGSHGGDGEDGCLLGCSAV